MSNMLVIFTWKGIPRGIFAVKKVIIQYSIHYIFSSLNTLPRYIDTLLFYIDTSPLYIDTN